MGLQQQPYTIYGDGDLELYQDVDLRDHSTMRVGGSARLFAKVRNTAEVQCAYQWAATNDIPVCMIGSGSNIIWPDTGYLGLVLQNAIRGFRIVSQDSNTTEIQLGAGEILDEVIERTIQMGLTGMECLSHIPGTLGGAIIQNSGAYGQDCSQVLQHVEVYDTHSDQILKLENNACGLGYRSSRFKNDEPGRYVILSLTVKLQKGPSASPPRPEVLAILSCNTPHTAADIRSAVIAIRRKKLPDPAVVPNCGSFFMNPTISQDTIIAALRSVQAPLHILEEQTYKVPAAWLIEHCGLKDHVDAKLGYGTWAGQPLVLYATRQSSCGDLLEYSAMIQKAVMARFGITLEREPVLMSG